MAALALASFLSGQASAALGACTFFASLPGVQGPGALVGLPPLAVRLHSVRAFTLGESGTISFYYQIDGEAVQPFEIGIPIASTAFTAATTEKTILLDRPGDHSIRFKCVASSGSESLSSIVAARVTSSSDGIDPRLVAVLAPMVVVALAIVYFLRSGWNAPWTGPDYDPGKWNDLQAVREKNNCYNYACDIRNDTFAQPGRASGSMYQSIDCQAVGSGAISDGLRQVDCDSGCGRRCHQVALVVAPGTNPDFHWYRLDRTLRWSHKPGGTEATDRDNAGALIMDPRTADRGPYTVFCGCYCVCKGKVSVG